MVNKDRIRIKIAFTFMILIFMAVIATGQFYFNEYNYLPTRQMILDSVYSLGEITRSSTIDLNKDYTNYTLAPVQEKTIVLRMDDLGAWHYQDVVVKITNEVLSRNMSLVVAVIPKDIEKDKRFTTWMNYMKKDSRLEIALHGWEHTPNEFKNLTEEQAFKKLDLGKSSISHNLGVTPVTFIPPYNEYSEGTIAALKALNFKVMSAKEQEYQVNQSLSLLGFDGRTYAFDESYFVPVDEVMSDCNKSLDKNNVCVIMIHPQDYMKTDSNGNKVLDETKYTKLLSLLDNVQKLDAQTKTFRDLLVPINQ